MPTKEEMLNSILAKQTPEIVAPEIDESLPDVKKVRRGDTVSVYTYNRDGITTYLNEPFTGEITRVYEEYVSGLGEYCTKFEVKNDNDTRKFMFGSQNIAAIKLVAGRPEFDESKIPSSIDSFKKTVKKKKSYYVVTFDIDQRDADCITVSSQQDGEPSVEELIKLAILEHYDDLSDYDGAWYNLGPLQEFLDDVYLRGFFYEPCNRFKIDGISITGYDAKKDEFYELPIPSLKDLGIKNIDEAYEHYFNVDGEDED